METPWTAVMVVNGIAVINNPPAYRFTPKGITSIALQPDGEIVGCGSLGSNDFEGTSGINFFGKFSANGLRDTTFGTYGNEDSIITNDPRSFTALDIQPDGKILLSGYPVQNAYGGAVFINRYQSDGKTLDPDFYNAPTNFAYFSGVAGQLFLSGNKIFIAGYQEIEIGISFATFFGVLRFNDSAGFAYPVTWLSFTANKKDDGVLLDWETAGETNNNYFSVERSRDGQDFYDIGTVKSKGILSQTAEYDFTDVEPLKGENYYRIKQVDLNGNYTYTDVKNINFENASAITIYPNPSSSHINVDGIDLASNPKISILDLSGKLIRQFIPSTTPFNINIEKLAAGTYLLQTIINGKSSTIKFVKQ